jgi:hypothetical protein
MYQFSGIFLGTLIDSDGGPRSRMDDEIVLTSLWVIVSSSELEIANGQSGGAKEENEQGRWVQAKDHDESSKGIPAARASMANKTAVGIVLGLFNPPVQRLMKQMV